MSGLFRPEEYLRASRPDPADFERVLQLEAKRGRTVAVTFSVRRLTYAITSCDAENDVRVVSLDSRYYPWRGTCYFEHMAWVLGHVDVDPSARGRSDAQPGPFGAVSE